jgi:hypothetical protein
VSASGALANADLTVNGGELNLSNSSQTVAAFSGTGGTVNIVAGNTLIVDQASDTTFAGTWVTAAHLPRAELVHSP